MITNPANSVTRCASQAEGDRQAAERILRDDVSNRAEHGDAPDDPPERTAELVASAQWLRKGRVA